MLAVDLAAIAVILATFKLVRIDDQDLLLFTGLVIGSVVQHEASRQLERIREITAEGVSYISLQSVWTFAGLLLLPPPLVAALITISYTHTWLRVSKRIVVHRWVFSGCTTVLASACAGAILTTANPAGYPGLPTGVAGVAAIVAAAGVRWLVNYALVIGALVLASPQRPARKALGRISDQLIEASWLSFGAIIAWLMVLQPAVVVLLLVPMLTMQRSLMVSQLEHAASTDSKTGLLNAMYWHELAKREMERAHRLQTTLGILMIDLDRFKEVNNHYGRLAGDSVLRAVAGAVKAEGRRDDLVARLAGEEFVILLPNISEAELTQHAEKICHRVRQLAIDVESEHGPATISELTVSVGGALYPDCAADLDALLLTADNALFSAKDAGRNGFCVVAATP